MLELCAKLGLEYGSVTAGLDSHEKYSAKLAELLEARKQALADDAKPTPAQLNMLKALKVKPADMKKTQTVKAASAMIDKLKQARDSQPEAKVRDGYAALLSYQDHAFRLLYV